MFEGNLMSNKRISFKLSALSLALFASGMSAYAAEDNSAKSAQAKESEIAVKANKSKKAAEEIEVIEVTGLRGSIKKSMNDKRFSSNISDSIFAEDIGKSTDQNIADALSRITGVSVQTVDGEGAKITVRGANSDQNMITLNGVQLTSSDFNQAVDLSAFSSDILSSINVVKTPSADHDEGSLGASVILNTTKPLNLTKDIRSLTLQGRYNDFSENGDYKISGSLSEKFLDDTFGVLITAYNETNSVRRDQYRVEEFEARDVRVARDQDGNIIRNTRVIAPKSIEYSLYENERNRHGATLALQYQPFDDTNIIFDATYSKQELVDANHKVSTRTRSDLPNFEEGVEAGNSTRPNPGVPYIPDFSDPQVDWWTVDTDTRTMIKSINRFADGGFGRRNGGEDTINNVVSLKIEQIITDNFALDFGANYSKTTLEPHGTVDMNMLNGSGMPAQVKARAGEYGTPHTGIQPAGYDCTSGVCNMVYGDGLVTLNDPDIPWDNEGSTAFNPDDIRSQSVNWMALQERAIEDEQKSVFVDFDWDVDFLGLTKIEFGAKYSQREKYVDDQNRQFRNTKQPIQITRYNSEGEPIGLKAVVSGDTISSVSADNFVSDEVFPYDNFMADLGFARSNITDGWQLISEEKLLELAYGNEDAELVTDNSRTRSATLKNSAAYAKVNFEYLEGKLTGDAGLRYVKTDVLTKGFSGAEFTGDGLDRIFDPFVWRQLRDRTNPACVNADTFSPNSNRAENRIDGTAWDRNGTPDDFSDDVRIPVDAAGVYPCFDVRTVQGADQGGAWWNARHQDITTLKRNIFTDDPSVSRNDSIRNFEVEGGNTYDLFLPSLNLNYQLNEDMIGRFAVSKTMSRPNIDSLKPGFKMKEGYWGDPTTPRGSTLTLNNPKLMPQKSNNLDLSFEWYFNESGMVSTALFYKDMSDFEEKEELIVYADDLRTKDLSNYDVDDLIKTEEQIRASFAADPTGFGACMPKRGNINDVTKDWWFAEDMLEHCGLFKASKVRNGKGATIKGLELGYRQTYDFLPGIWSGLGIDANYTYQESETDLEFSSINPTLELPQFPRAWTPTHSYNATVFWEKDGHQIRLAYRGVSDQLKQASFSQGAVWREGGATLDLSANYQVSKDISASLQIINLTDESTRDFYTSRTLDLGQTQLNEAGEEVSLAYDEGNVQGDSGATTSRTQTEYKNGRTFRLGLRVNF
jgi:TonB-dependent receptor